MDIFKRLMREDGDWNKVIHSEDYNKGFEEGYIKGEKDAWVKKINEVDELFGRFIVAFDFMDAEWRRCVLQYLTVMNDQLLEEEK